MTINEIQDEIIEEFADIDDWMDRYPYIIEMGTMPGKAPTIMKGPDYRLSGIFQIFKKLFHIQVKTMNIVQMNNVRIVFFDSLNEFYRLFLGGKSMLPF